MLNRNTTIFLLVVGILLLFSGCAREIHESPKKADSIPESLKGIEIAQNEREPVKILFVGDMMFDRYIRSAVEKYGKGDYNYVLELLKEKLSEYDLVVGNLEGPITDKGSVSAGTAMDEKRNLVFTFDPAVAKVLTENNIKLVNIGNNHILNQGEGGLRQTKEYLDEAGVEYFGDTGAGEDITIIKEIKGTKIGFVGYNYSVENPELNSGKLPELSSDLTIICPHWGTEYKTGDPGKTVRTLAYHLIDSGAGAIVGTHPHVVQMSEEYNGKKIYYSLGNFVFDQYFQPETMKGLGVEMTVNTDGRIEYNELNFEMTKRGQTILKTGN